MSTVPLSAFKEELARTAEVVAGVRPDQMTGATPCSDWDTRALINHLIGVNYAFVRAASGTPPDFSGEMPDLAGDDAGAAYRESARVVAELFDQPGVLDRTFRLPGAEVTGHQAFHFALMEAVVHGWDLAMATGHVRAIPAPVAEMVLTNARMAVAEELRDETGRIFKPEVAVPSEARSRTGWSPSLVGGRRQRHHDDEPRGGGTKR